MALVSPGVSISINDQSQYVNSNVGSVPLVLLATAQDKTYNGAAAVGTSKAYAGKLQSFTSQRELVTAMGTPNFQTSTNGTSLNGSELNEYGLMTSYSALGITNQLYAIRADIDLNQLVGTSVRPIGTEADGTLWLDLANTEFGVYTLNATTSSFTSIDSNLLLITSANQVTQDTVSATFAYTVPAPISSVGNPGQYAMVFVNADGTTPQSVRLYYKATTSSINGSTQGGFNNQWIQVGPSSPNWQYSVPAVAGNVSNPSNLSIGSNVYINGSNVTTTGTTVTQLASDINNAAITGVKASAATGVLQLFVTSAAASGAGTLTITEGTGTPLTKCGISAGTYYCPTVFYGSYAQAPSGGWFSTDSQPRPSGSIWWKTTATGGGFNPVLKQYSASQDSWNPLSVPMYYNTITTINAFDYTGGGLNIPIGTWYAGYIVGDSSYNQLRFNEATSTGPVSATGGPATTFVTGNSILLNATAQSSSSFNQYTITVGADTSAAGFVAAILAKNIPFVTATYNATSNTITITHTAGGQIQIQNASGNTGTQPLTSAGFVSGQGTGFIIGSATGYVYISNFTPETQNIVYSKTQPQGNPATGTYWYYSNPADIDIMINYNGTWHGYQNVTQDIRGYNLSQTSPGGVIITPNTAPTSQSDGTALVKGDLWLDSGNLINFPSLYRYTGTAWVAIDNTDHVSNNGIIFADARWDSTGTTDPISGTLPSITTLLTSNYVDQDVPDPRLYPRGTLLFNTRRSGFNVKKFVANYFNSTSFPSPGTTPGTAGTLPSIANAWVSASGNNEQGVMYGGSAAQRALIVDAMESAISSNTDILEQIYQFNLITAPNYPELIPDMITLNSNRGDTAFVIGDTPMTLTPTSTVLTAWSNNTNGTGLSTASPYLAVYYPAGLTNDLAGNQIVMPASHAALYTYLYNDQVSHPWFAPAGTHRGLVSTFSDIGYLDANSGSFIHNGINQGLRDLLSSININPITNLPGVGLVIWGQETRSGDTSSRNRVNVVRLENYLRTILATIANGFLFEPNDTITRKTIATQIESALNNLVAQRGIYDYLVICDTSNNTPSTIANNQLYVDVAIEPVKDVEYIYIPIALYNPGTIAALGKTST